MVLRHIDRPARDDRAEDGGFYAGWRLVRPKGRVKAGGRWWRHDKLLRQVGKRVWVKIDCYWGTEASACLIEDDMFLCKLEKDDK